MKPKVIELLEQIKLFPGMKEKKEVLSEGCYVKGDVVGKIEIKNDFGKYVTRFYYDFGSMTQIIHIEDVQILGHLPTYMDLLVCLGDRYSLYDTGIFSTNSMSLELEINEGLELHEQPDSVLDEIIILLKEQLGKK